MTIFSASYSVRKILNGPEATSASVGIKNLEDDSEIVAALRRPGEDIIFAYFSSR